MTISESLSVYTQTNTGYIGQSKFTQCRRQNVSQFHYNDVIISAMASQIASLTIVYSSVYSGADQRKLQSSASLAFNVGNSPVTGEFPTQRASNAENVSIWWCHRVFFGQRVTDLLIPPCNTLCKGGSCKSGCLIIIFSSIFLYSILRI